MADAEIAAFTDGVTANATDRIAAARSPFGAGDDRYLTPAYIKDYILGLANTFGAGLSQTMGKLVLTSAGTVGAPAIVSSHSADTGIWWTSAAGMNFSFNGGAYVSIGSSTNTGIRMHSSIPMGWVDGESNSNVADIAMKRSAAGIVQIFDGSTAGGAVEMIEMTAPSAPSANRVRLYIEDNGSGKTRLMALFSSGAAQQVAIQP